MKAIVAAFIVSAIVAGAAGAASTLYLTGGLSHPAAKPAQPASAPADAERHVIEAEHHLETDPEPVQQTHSEPTQESYSTFWNRCYQAHEADIGFDGPTSSEVGDYCRQQAAELGLQR
jgi:hypothetical protein